jgi:hypothetical protein
MLAAVEQSSLFEPVGGSRFVLRASKRDLARWLGIAPGSLTRRLASLQAAGLVSSDGGAVVVDGEALRERLKPGVVVLPTERTRQFQAAVESSFVARPAADGTVAYHHPDGQRASLAELARAAGCRSRGTAQHHLHRFTSPPAETSPEARDGGQEPPTATPVGAVMADACAAALESLGALTQVAADTGDVELGRVAASCIASVADLLVARTRINDALREPSNDANASPNAFASHDLPNDEYENESSHPHERGVREANASLNARTPHGVPATSRAFDEPPDWSVDEVGEVVVGPIVTAYTRATGRHITVDVDWFVDDLLAWPRPWVERAVGILVDQIQRGRHIINPGGLFAKAVTEGWTEYFPLHLPPDPSTPGSDDPLSAWNRVNGLRATSRSRHDALADGMISEFENRVWADCGSRIAGLSDARARQVWLAAWRQRLDAGDPPLTENPAITDARPTDEPEPEPGPQHRLVGPRIGSPLRRRGVPQHMIAAIGRAGDEAVQAGAERDLVANAILAAIEAAPGRATVDELVEASLRAAERACALRPNGLADERGSSEPTVDARPEGLA